MNTFLLISMAIVCILLFLAAYYFLEKLAAVEQAFLEVKFQCQRLEITCQRLEIAHTDVNERLNLQQETQALFQKELLEGGFLAMLCKVTKMHASGGKC